MKKSISSKLFPLLPLAIFTVSCVVNDVKIFTRTAMAAEVTWSEWTPLNDKAQKGIDWRAAQGDSQEADGLVQWNYQFRNRYPKKVTFQSTLNYEDKDGVNQTIIKV